MTAAEWLKQVDVKYGFATKNYYNDKHEHPLVLLSKAKYVAGTDTLQLRNRSLYYLPTHRSSRWRLPHSKRERMLSRKP